MRTTTRSGMQSISTAFVARMAIPGLHARRVMPHVDNISLNEMRRRNRETNFLNYHNSYCRCPSLFQSNAHKDPGSNLIGIFPSKIQSLCAPT
jgi:hypothetical protein